jgi:long-chain-fatty-acid---luciferin-component ligase
MIHSIDQSTAMTITSDCSAGELIAERVRPADYTSLDYTLYTATDSYRRPPLHDELLEWITESLRHHLSHSASYARLADARGFRMSRFEDTGDLGSIPLVSSGSFKRRSIRTTTPGPVRACTSSGTMGSKSVIPRDDRTLERFIGTVMHGTRHFLGQAELRKGFVLGPPREQAGDLWFSYALGLAEVLHDAEYFVKQERLAPEALYTALGALDGDVQPIIVSPPSLLLALVQWMEARGAALRLGDYDAIVMTAGGWKRNASEAVDRADLEQRTADRLGIGPGSFRDLFNMVELNSLIFECDEGRKHIPPWLHVDARSAATLAPVAPGERGLLAYLDPTPLSYPGFVLSDDIGAVRSVRCACGIEGPELQLERRLTSIEERGCGMKMNRYQVEASGQ